LGTGEKIGRISAAWTVLGNPPPPLPYYQPKIVMKMTVAKKLVIKNSDPK